MYALTDFHCVVCGEKITTHRADICRVNGLPGCCSKHEHAMKLDLYEHLPSWNDHFVGGWSKNAGDDYWLCNPVNLRNDGVQYYAQTEQVNDGQYQDNPAS